MRNQIEATIERFEDKNFCITMEEDGRYACHKEGMREIVFFCSQPYGNPLYIVGSRITASFDCALELAGEV